MFRPDKNRFAMFIVFSKRISIPRNVRRQTQVQTENVY